MTRAATAPELTALRSHGQWARWRCIIDRPDTVYTARAVGVINTDTWAITFDGGSGTLTDCLEGMTLLVGTSAGAWNVGIARLRKTSGGSDTAFSVGADPALEVQDNDYLTVINDMGIWSRHPIGEYIDTDVAYDTQFTNFIPVPVFKERIAIIDAGETIGFDASASWVIGSTITGYSWTFTGATSSADTSTATPTATYNTSGRYRVKLTVTAANSKSADGYGWVYVLGENLAPDTGIVIDSLEGETGAGWTCKLRAYDRPTIKDRARVIIYSEDYFDNVLGSKGPVTGRENILLVGWIIGETIIREPGQDSVEFSVGGPGALCGVTASMPAGLVDDLLPTEGEADLPAWTTVTTLTVRIGLHYLINYRSTLARVCDVEVEDWTTKAGSLSTDADNLFGQLTDYALSGAMTVTPDRYGHIYIERDASLYPMTDRMADIPIIMALTDADWMDELSVNRRQVGDASIVEMEGVVYADGVEIATGARSPGEIPAATGQLESTQEYYFASKAEAYELAGLMAGQLNAEYEGFTATLAQNNHFIDVSPRQYVTAVIDSENVNCIPRRLSIRHDDESGAVTLDVDLEPIGGQYNSEYITYPGDEDNPPVDPGYEPPPPPPPNDDPGNDDDIPGTGDAVCVTTTDVRSTNDLSAESPTWQTEL